MNRYHHSAPSLSTKDNEVIARIISLSYADRPLVDDDGTDAKELALMKELEEERERLSKT